MIMVLAVALAALATVRGTRFITQDYLAGDLRNRIVRKFGEESKIAYLFHCWACASIWVGGLVAFWMCVFVTPWWTWPLQVAAYSELTVLIARSED